MKHLETFCISSTFFFPCTKLGTNINLHHDCVFNAIGYEMLTGAYTYAVIDVHY